MRKSSSRMLFDVLVLVCLGSEVPAFANTESLLGFHFHFGIGAEYRLRPGITLATMFKPTFTPGIDNFWFSRPILIGRFAL